MKKKPLPTLRARYEFHLFRLEREQRERAERLAARAVAAQTTPDDADQKQALIAAAMARARQAAQKHSNE